MSRTKKYKISRPSDEYNPAVDWYVNVKDGVVFGPYEVHIFHKDQDSITFEEATNGVIEEGGAITDITPRKRMRRKL